MAVRGALVSCLFAVATTSPALAGDLSVIVHPKRETRLTTAELAQIYLKTRRFWENGERIVAVNRNSQSEARDVFVHVVFGKNAQQLAFYWNQQYFRGILPPATLASDEAVRRFVAEERLAIGYVHPGWVDPSVKSVLRLVDDRKTQQTLPRYAVSWLRRMVARLGRRSPPQRISSLP